MVNFLVIFPNLKIIRWVFCTTIHSLVEFLIVNRSEKMEGLPAHTP